MEKRPIFIIGTERSGTNLLRAILNSHSNIAIPHPPHIMENFFKIEPLYSVFGESGFKAMINDVVRMVELHPYSWPIRIDRERIFIEAKSRDLINIFFCIYEQYLEYTGKKRWGCKSTFMINHVALVRHYYPKAQFIYMVRDGRDVAVSAQKSIFNNYSIYYIARRWQKEQGLGIYWLNKLSREEIYLLKYEDLIDSPLETINKICIFLGETFENRMLEFFQDKDIQKGAALSVSWKNMARPIIKGNYDKYKYELTKKDIELFEALTWREMDYFSYKLTNPVYFLESFARQKERPGFYDNFQEVMGFLKIQFFAFFTDKNNFLRYKKRIFLNLLRFYWIVKWILSGRKTVNI